jgi:alkylation response protein AidB-like acyl-CoA dehydrogenase
MNLLLSEDQSMLLDTVTRLFTRESTSERVRLCEPIGFDPNLWRSLVDLGLPLLRVDEQHGGIGGSLREMTLVSAAAGRQIASAPIADVAVAARLLSLIDTAAAQCWLERMGTGDAIVTLAWQQGTDQIVSSAAIADAIIHLDGDTLKLAVVGEKKISHRANLGSLPLGGFTSSDFENVELMHGRPAQRLFEAAREEWQLLTAAMLLGICERAQEFAAEYGNERTAFGVKIGSFQGLSHPLAESRIGLEGGQLLIDYALWSIQAQRQDAAAQVAMAYWWATQVSQDSLPRCLHIFGGYGVSEEHDIQLFVRRGIALGNVLGDAQQVLLSVADRLWGDEYCALPSAGDTNLDFDLGSAAHAMTDRVNAFFREHLTEESRPYRHHSWDGYMPRMYKKLATENLLFPHWPKAYGGLEATPAERYALTQAFYENRWTIFPQSTSRIIGEMILKFGTESLKAKVLPEIVRGEAVCCLGLTEPHCGSDVFAAKTRAVRKGQNWVINGQKMFTSGANIGKYVMLLTNTDPEAAKHVGKTLFLVPLDHPGVEVHRVDTISADRTNITYYTDVEIPDDYRLGEVNSGSSALGYMLSLEQDGSPYGFEFAHLIRQVADWARETARGDGVVFDCPLAKSRLATAAVHHKVAEVLFLRMVHNEERHLVQRHHASMLKAFTTESWKNDAQALLALTAPYSLISHTENLGYVEEGWRSSLAACIYGGSTQVHLSVTAEKALGLPRSR